MKKFTAPDGSPLWIAKEHIVAVVRATGNANPVAATQIDTGNGRSYYVKETPDRVVEKMQ